MYKIQVQEADGYWYDFHTVNDKLLICKTEQEARAKLEEFFPTLVEMERHIRSKRTRIKEISPVTMEEPKEKSDKELFFDWT
jgi:glycine cleavage system protein P-like pyridoxal-binding family